MSRKEDLTAQLDEVNRDILCQAQDHYNAVMLEGVPESEQLAAESSLRMLLSYKVQVLEELLALGCNK